MNPIIETERLLIRTPRLGDEIELNQAINRSLNELQRWELWASDPSLETTAEFIKNGVESWDSDKQSEFPMIVIHKQDKMIIGASGYNKASEPSVPYYEIGYWIDTQYTGLGLATELTNALTRYAFVTLKAIRTQIFAHIENLKSIRVAQKCGYTLEATLHNTRIDCKTGKPADSVLFACFDNSDLPISE